jgi:transposase
LAWLGIRGFKPHLRHAAARLETLRTPEGTPLPGNTLAELRREMARLQLIAGQIREIETNNRHIQVYPAKAGGQHTMVAAAIRQAFLHADAEAARQDWRHVADQLRARWP